MRSRSSVRPRTRTPPVVGRRWPTIILMMVDLPAPLMPSRPKTVPLWTLRLTPRTASKVPNLRPRFSVSMALSPNSKFSFALIIFSGRKPRPSPADRLGLPRLDYLFEHALERLAQLLFPEAEVHPLDQSLFNQLAQDLPALVLRHLDALARDERPRALPLVDDALVFEVE